MSSRDPDSRLKAQGSKLKIGFVIDDGLDRLDGVQQYVLTLGSWLSSKGHEVRYLAGETKRKDIDGVYSLSNNLRVSFNGNGLSTPKPASTQKIREVLKSEKFDILHVQAPYSPFMAAKIVKLAPKRTIIVGTFHILPYGIVTNIGTRLLGIYLNRNLKRFNAFISVSKPAQVFAAKSFSIPSEVIPNPVDVAKFKPKKNTRPRKDKKLKVLYLGRLVPRKGCHLLLEALTLMDASQLEVDICGNGPMRESLENFVRDNNLENIVTLHGFISDEDKVKFMQGADIAVFPSTSGESFGIVLIEALAAGAGVVIGGDNPGYRSVLGSVPSSIIDAKDPSKLARHLEKLINDKKLRQEIHVEQQSLVDRYDVNAVGKQILKIYEDCKKPKS